LAKSSTNRVEYHTIHLFHHIFTISGSGEILGHAIGSLSSSFFISILLPSLLHLRKIKEAVNEIDRFIKSEEANEESETPKDVVNSLLALKEHILCVHFMIKMHINMRKEEVKSKMNEEKRNAFWTIVDREKFVIHA
jgi:hypothetical protein